MRSTGGLITILALATVFVVVAGLLVLRVVLRARRSRRDVREAVWAPIVEPVGAENVVSIQRTGESGKIYGQQWVGSVPAHGEFSSIQLREMVGKAGAEADNRNAIEADLLQLRKARKHL